MDKRTAALAFNLLACLLAFAGVILTALWTTSRGSFSLELNVLGFIFALTVIAAGLTYHFQVSKA